MDLVIRTGSLNDLDTIAEFNLRMARETEARELDLSVLRSGVAAVLADRTKGRYYVAEAGGEIVGQLLITYEWSDWRNGMFWWIQSVYVPEAWRGKKVFGSLYAHVRRLAQVDNGVCGIRLYVEHENVRAQRTYEHLGMTETAYRLFEVDFTARGRS